METSIISPKKLTSSPKTPCCHSSMDLDIPVVTRSNQILDTAQSTRCNWRESDSWVNKLHSLYYHLQLTIQLLLIFWSFVFRVWASAFEPKKQNHQKTSSDLVKNWSHMASKLFDGIVVVNTGGARARTQRWTAFPVRFLNINLCRVNAIRHRPEYIPKRSLLRV